MDTKSSTDILYHYTDNAGLVGILRSGELWFSDIRFLNDARELHCARDIITQGVLKVANRHRRTWIEAGCAGDQFDLMVQHLIRHISANWHHQWSGKPMPSTTPFIFSMTTDPDSLSQWRAYGNGEYCIGFDKSKLLERIAEAELIKVKYVKDPKDVEFYVIGDEFFDRHIKHIYDGIIDSAVLRDGASELFQYGNPLYDPSVLVTYKDFGFHEEDEYRLVLQVDPSTNDKLIFATSGTYPRPRVRVKIFERGDGFSVVKKIKVGPGLDHALAKTALDVLFASTHCEGVKVCGSEIPYRAKWE